MTMSPQDLYTTHFPMRGRPAGSKTRKRAKSYVAPETHRNNYGAQRLVRREDLEKVLKGEM